MSIAPIFAGLVPVPLPRHAVSCRDRHPARLRGKQTDVSPEWLEADKLLESALPLRTVWRLPTGFVSRFNAFAADVSFTNAMVWGL